MKQRIIRTLLVLLALGVWGAVVVRAIKHPSETTGLVIAPVRTSAPKTTVRPMPSLHLERDPFLDGAAEAPRQVVRSSATPHRTTAAATRTPESSTPWPKITYTGMMKGKDATSSVAFLTINGKQHIGREGATVDGMRIARIQGDSINVERQGDHRWVRRR